MIGKIFIGNLLKFSKFRIFEPATPHILIKSTENKRRGVGEMGTRDMGKGVREEKEGEEDEEEEEGKKRRRGNQRRKRRREKRGKSHPN